VSGGRADRRGQSGVAATADHGLVFARACRVRRDGEHHARTLLAVVEDVDESLRAAGVENMVIVNGHGGNYALRNAVQQSTTLRPRMALFPATEDWNSARVDAGCKSSSHEDMHGGELEVSLLLHGAPHLLRDGYQSADHEANQRPDLLTVGMRAYTSSGIIGRPSLGSAEKGTALLDSLSRSFARVHQLLEPER
jgi:creatinine amidohydrolase